MGIYEQSPEVSGERHHSENSTLYIIFSLPERPVFFALGSVCSKRAGLSGSSNKGYKGTESQMPPSSWDRALSGAAALPGGRGGNQAGQGQRGRGGF